MVRTVQASARHEIRSSWAAEESLQYDQRRLRDYQEEGQGQRSFRFQGEGEALRKRGSMWPSQRVPQAARAGCQAEAGSNSSRTPGRLTASATACGRQPRLSAD